MPVGHDNIPVPAETPLSVPRHRSVSIVVTIHVDKTVSLFPLRFAVADKVDRSPARIAENLNAVPDRFAHLKQMLPEEVDPISVVDGEAALSVRNQLVVEAHSVFDDKQRKLISVPELIKQVSETDRIDLIAPVGGFQIRVFNGPGEISPGLLQTIGIRRGAVAGVVAERDKIYRILEREYPEAYLETLVVLDGTTGQNALAQAKQFAEVANVNGIILTKLDGTAKGGIAVAIQSELDIPVKYIGVGETIDDLQKFDADAFVNALFDIDKNETNTEE